MQRAWSLPNKLYEYFQAGIPVLCTAVQELSETLERLGAGRTYEFDDPEDFAHQVMALRCRWGRPEIDRRTGSAQC